jgi:hypothetical protein
MAISGVEGSIPEQKPNQRAMFVNVDIACDWMRLKSKRKSG